MIFFNVLFVVRMNFTDEQITYLVNLLLSVDIQRDRVDKIKEKLTTAPTTVPKTRTLPKSKAAAATTTATAVETCIGLTKTGKRCSKKPKKGQNTCSIHTTTTAPAPLKIELPIAEIQEMSKEDKKKQIEKLFDEVDDEDGVVGEEVEIE